MPIKLAIITATFFMMLFGAILQNQNVMNLLTFWVYFVFVVTFLGFLRIMKESPETTKNDMKGYEPSKFITVFSRSINIITVIALVYHGYIILPIFLLLVMFFGLSIRMKVEESLESGDTEKQQ